MKKQLCIILMSIMLLSCAACQNFGGEQTEKVDPTRTQLYVQNFEGGYGSEWMVKIKERFEEFYKDKSFESGKTGVQVMITKAKVDGITLKSKINEGMSEVFFNESVYYYDYLSENLLLDISDVVQQSLSEFGDNQSIEDKMSAEQKAYYKTTQGKYYGVPHYAGYNGMVYDVNLFDEYLLYFKDVSGQNSMFIVNETDKKSKGPDGLYDTYDDGFPATYEEFFMLCDYMVELGITPFVWAGQYYNTYIEKIIYALTVDHEGLDQTMLNYTFQGTAKNIITPVSSNGEYSYKYGEDGVQITPKNAYELWASEGKYQSLKFFERVVKNSDYYNKLCFSPSHLYTDAQKDYLESTPKGKPIAMILEGCWWENEAKDEIKVIADTYGQEYSQKNRRFAMLPMPKASAAEIGDKNTIVDTHYSLGFIKASIAPHKIDLAKKFLMFCNTDQSLSEFTAVTNSVKALNYSLTDEQYNALSNYGKSVHDLHLNSDIVYPYSTQPVYLDNQSTLSIHNSYGSLIGTREELHPMSYLRDDQRNNMRDYFNGMREYNVKRWDRIFGGYFN